MVGGDRRGQQFTPVAIVKATEEESFHTTALLENQAAGSSRGLVEHKGTLNQRHFPSCSETGHKERWAGGHDIGWSRVKLHSLCRWLLKLVKQAWMNDDTICYLTSLVYSTWIYKNCHEDRALVTEQRDDA